MKKIMRADEATAREKVAKAIGVKMDDVHLAFGLSDHLLTIESPQDCGLSAPEIVALAAVGIRPGPEGWGMDDAPAPVLHALPAGVAWYQYAINEHRLEAGRRVLATVRFWENDAGWAIGERSYEASDGWTLTATLDAAKGAAEAACREWGLFAALPNPELTTSTPQGHSSGDAARTLRRLLSLCAREDEHGPIASPAGETPEERADARGRLVDAFVAEIGAARAQVADLEIAIGEAREEADTSDANAVELAGKLDTAQKRIAEMGGEIDALHVALEASRGARVEADLLHIGAIRRAEKAEAELDAIRSKIATIIGAVATRTGGAS